MKTLKENYKELIIPQISKEESIKNILAVPTPKKVVLNMGLGEALKDPGVFDTYTTDIQSITGQKPVITRATKSVAEFNLKKGDKVGLKVTLRGDKMWHFLDKIINIVLPRVKDFRGISATSFDKEGTYTLAVVEHAVFPEIDQSKVSKIKGLSITIVFSNSNPALSRKIMDKMGFIFKK